jgi:hypothetical protein
MLEYQKSLAAAKQRNIKAIELRQKQLNHTSASRSLLV